MNGPEQAALERRIMRSTYLGIPALKMPTDAWAYQEILHTLRPDTIIEVGNHAGGTLLYLAHLCERLGSGQIIGVDIDHSRVGDRVREHPLITLVTGDAIDVLAEVAARTRGTTLVIEDSYHGYEHTLNVMHAYGDLVTVGSYMIVEDGVMADVERAIRTFVGEQSRFVTDVDAEWPLTWNPGGYLLRTR